MEALRSPRQSGQLLLHFGMALATLAFASWWTSHTILDASRTRRVTTAVLESADLRHYLSREIGPAVASAVGQPSLNVATGAPPAAAAASASTDALILRMTAVLDRADIRAKLEQFIVAAHERLIGQGSAPAVLDKPTVVTIVNAAVPTLSLQDLGKIPPVTINVPRVTPLAVGRKALHNRFPLYALGALVLVAAAITVSRDRRTTVKVVGRWLLGISAAHLLVLWIIPVLIVPQVSHSPWASLIAAVARALNAGILTGLILLALAGVAFLTVDRFVPSVGGTGAPVASEATGEL